MTRFVAASAMRHIARPAVGAVHSIMSRLTQLPYDKRNMDIAIPVSVNTFEH